MGKKLVIVRACPYCKKDVELGQHIGDKATCECGAKVSLVDAIGIPMISWESPIKEK